MTPGQTFEIDWKRPDYAQVWEARIDRLRRIRAGEVDMSALREFYKMHPVEFIIDWGCTFDPRMADIGLKTTMPFILFKKQVEFILWLRDLWKGRKDGVCEKSRDMGASWLCVAFAVWMWLFHDGVVVGFGSRKETYVDELGDPKSIFWKIRAFIKLLPAEFRPAGYNEKVYATFMKIVNPVTQSAIIGEAGDNIGRGNRASIYFVDEGAFLERPEAAEAALSNTTNCQVWLSTVNGTGNVFHRRRMSGKYPVFVFDWRDDPRKGPDWYEDMKAKTEPHILAQEVDRDYSAAVTDSFVPGAIVTAAMHRGPMDVSDAGPVQVGIDCARFGNDKSCIVTRKGRLAARLESFGKVDVVDVAGRAKDYILTSPEVVEQISVDTIGIGSGVADMLRRDFGDRVVDVNSGLRLDDGRNYNLRARMWRDLREWLKGPVSIPNDHELETDLTALRYSYRGGLLLIESKEEAKKRGIKSPDRADALALTFAYPVAEPDRPVDETLNPAWEVIDELVGY